MADSDDGAAWRLAGLVGIGDPPRAAAGDVVRRLERAGIRVVLVTGDHPGTAAAIARQVGICHPGDQPVEGGDLAAAALLALAVWLPAAQELLGTRTIP